MVRDLDQNVQRLHGVCSVPRREHSFFLANNHTGPDIYAVSDCHWAEPRISEATAWLRRLKADPRLRSKLGEAGYQRVRNALDPENQRGVLRDSHGLIEAAVS